MRTLIIDPTPQVTTNPEPFLIHGVSQATGEVLIAYQINTHGCHQVGRYNATDGKYLGDWGIWTASNAQWLIVDATLQECTNTSSGYAMMVRAADPTGAIYMLMHNLDGTILAQAQITTPAATTGAWQSVRHSSPMYVPGQGPQDVCAVTVGASSLTPANHTLTGLPGGSKITAFSQANNVYLLVDTDGANIYKMDTSTFACTVAYNNATYHMRTLDYDSVRKVLWITTDEGVLIKYDTVGNTGTVYTNWMNIPIKSITKTNPVVIQTTKPHGFAALDSATISGVAGMTGINGLSGAVTVIDSTHFSLPIDATGFGTYTGGGIASYVLTANMVGRTGPGNCYASVQYGNQYFGIDLDKLWVSMMVNSAGSTDYHPYVYMVNPDTFEATVFDPLGDGGQQSLTGGGKYPQLPQPSGHGIFNPQLPGSAYFSTLGYKPNGYASLAVMGPGTNGSTNHFVGGRILRYDPYGEAASPSAQATVTRCYAPTFNNNAGDMYGVHCDNPVTGEALMCYQNSIALGNFSFGQGASIIGRFNPTTGAYLGDWGDFTTSSPWQIIDQILTFDPDNSCFFAQAWNSTGVGYVLKIDPTGHVLSAVTVDSLFGVGSPTHSPSNWFTTRNRFNGDIWVQGPNANFGKLNRAATPITLAQNVGGSGGNSGTGTQLSSLEIGPNGEMWGTVHYSATFPNARLVQYDPGTQTYSQLWGFTTGYTGTAYGCKYDDKRKVLWTFMSDGSLVEFNVQSNTATQIYDFIRIPIASISNTNPAIVQTNRTHGFIDGDLCKFSNVGGMTGINGLSGTVTYIDSTHFSVNIDATGFGAFTGGGTANYTSNFYDSYESPMSYDPYRDCLWFGCFNQNNGTHPHLYQIDLTTFTAQVYDPNQDGSGLSVTQTDMGSGFYGDSNPNVAIFAPNYAQFAIAAPGVDNFIGLKPELIRIAFSAAPTVKLRRMGMHVVT